MDWNNPDRRRRLVTYGRSSHTQSGHNRQSLPSNSVSDERHTNGLNAPLRPELQARLQMSETRHVHHRMESSEDRSLKEKMSYESGAFSQDSRRNLRSPKRRKVLADDGEQDLASRNKPQSKVAANDNLRSSNSRPRSNPNAINSLTTADKKGAGAAKSPPRTPPRSSTSRNRLKSYDKSDIWSTAPFSRPSSLSNNEEQGLLTSNSYHSQPGSVISHRLSHQKRAHNRDLSSPNHAQNGAATHTEEPSTRRRLVDSLGVYEVQEDEIFSERDSVKHPSSTHFSTQTPRTPTATESQNSLIGREDARPRCFTNDMVETTTSPQSSSPKITYARQRSFLSNIDFNSDLSTDGQSNLYGDLHALTMQSTSAPNAENEHVGDAGTVRSIHELRRAGVNARFQGVVDSILEDIEEASNSVSVRRSGLIHLCEKLLEDSFAQRFIESGAFSRLADCISAKLDVISSLLSVEAYALILRLNHLPSNIYTTFWPKLIALAPGLLSLQEGISKLLEQRRFGLSRNNQATINDVSIRSGQVAGLNSASLLTPRRLVLHCIQCTIRKVRDGDFADVLPVKIVSELVKMLLTLSGHASEHATNQRVISENYTILESIISILETYTTSSTSIGGAQQDALTLLADSSYFLTSLNEESDPQCLQLLTLHLRLILNITNTNSHICEGFATPDLIRGLVMIVLSSYPGATGDTISEKKDSLDIVILALGALINLTEESKAARQNIFSQRHDSRTLLEHLLAVFTEGLDTVSEADSVGQTHSNVAFGYLSILLCTMCLNQDVRAVIKGSLNGVGLEKILATVEEFLHYHRKVDEELSQSQSLGEFTARLQRILDQIRGSVA